MNSSDKPELNTKNWIWSLFYFNKNDQRIFVDKPNPNDGITLNFAQPKTYGFLLLVFAFFGFILYMIERK
ncbi:MAG: hypothetical protein JST78_04405 [Bacteroidetes bacterium]|nr:hypothetical protein [Bacteroidota bacterium]